MVSWVDTCRATMECMLLEALLLAQHVREQVTNISLHLNSSYVAKMSTDHISRIYIIKLFPVVHLHTAQKMSIC